MVYFFIHQLDYIYFIYGLGFIVLSIVGFSVNRQKPQDLPWGYLASFGVLHGFSEWLVLLAVNLSDTVVFEAIRVAFAAVSYIFLFYFGFSGLQRQGYDLHKKWTIPLVLLALLSATKGPTGFDVGTRYTFGLIGGLMSSFALYLASKTCSPKGSKWLVRSGFIFLLYTISSCIIVPRVDFFPANIINVEGFMLTFGVPIQLIRGLASLMVAITIIFWYANVSRGNVDKDREYIRKRAILLRRMVAGLIILIVFGWVLTNWVGEHQKREKLKLHNEKISTIVALFNQEFMQHFFGNAGTGSQQTSSHIIRHLQAIRLSSVTYRRVSVVKVTAEELVLLASSQSDGLNVLPRKAVSTKLLEQLDQLSWGEYYVTNTYSLEGKSYSSLFLPLLKTSSYPSDKLLLSVEIDHHLFWKNEVAIYRAAVIISVLAICWLILLMFAAWQKSTELAIQAVLLRMAGADQQNEKRLRSITSALGEGLLVIDRQGLVTFMNPEAERLLGYYEAELCGKKPVFYDTISIDSNRPKVIRNDDAVFVRKDGTVFDVSFVANPLRDEEKFNGYVIGFRDISLRKQLEREIIRMDQLSLIGEMAAGIGHEVRNPLTTAKGFLQLLKVKPECEKYQEFFTLIIDELDRANAIITEYLSLAKDKRLQLEKRNLNKIITELHDLLVADAMMGDKSLLLDLGNIPDLMLDQNEIKQVIINLVRNGLESMGPSGELLIRTYVEKDQVVMVVQDQGCGIEENVLSNIGKPFFTTKDNGIGLGVAVCLSVASRHKAIIDFSSNRAGTTVYVRFPVPGC